MHTFDDLLKLVDILLGPNGCPWDKEQTIFSLQKHLLEETHEVIETIDTKDFDHMKEELGDLLYALVFIAKLSQKEGHFTMEEVVDDLYKKYVNRHPHIFGDQKLKTSDEVIDKWEKIKLKEKVNGKKTSTFPPTMPLLLKAHKIVKKIAKKNQDVNFQVSEKDNLEEKAAKKILNVIVEAENQEINVEDGLRRYLDLLIKEYNL
jgi:tetrapyrrole methylase family protein / MazG family protein